MANLETRTCPNCGTPQPAGAMQCGTCGTRLTLMLSKDEARPELVIVPDDGQPLTVRLKQPRLHIGTDPDQEIRLEFPGIAARMARLVREGASYRFYDLTRYPGDVLVNGKFIENHLLRHKDVIRLQDGTGAGVTITYQNPFEQESQTESLKLYRFKDYPFTIGRSPASALHLPALAVSWHHAQIVQQGSGHILQDLDSTNGTYVNGQRLNRPYRLKPDDFVRIDQTSLMYKENGLLRLSTLQTFELDAVDLEMTVRSGLVRRRAQVLISGVSLSVEPQEFVAIIGGSGSGKSTLLRALNGANPATGGQVIVNGDDLYKSYEMYQPLIGYVPQTDIVQDSLTVYQSLLFGARLRFPTEPPASHEQRVEKALADVELSDIRNRLVGRLSGGQRKRVSIALELLAEPHLLFMDEPSSGLDPGLDRSIMETLRRLAARGNIVLVVTHTTLNIGICDKLALMARGQLVYYGPPKDALTYFDVRDYTELYNRVMQPPEVNGSSGKVSPEAAAALWAERYRQSEQYTQYVVRMREQTTYKEADKAIISNKRLRRSRQGSWWQQAVVLTQRTLAVARRDFRTMIALMVVLPLVGLFLGLISRDPLESTQGQMLVDRFQGADIEAYLIERLPLSRIQAEPPAPVEAADSEPAAPPAEADPGSFTLGGGGAQETAEVAPICPSLDEAGTYTPAAEAQRLLFMLSLAVVLLGIFASAYTIVEEKSLFLRERMANLRIAPYLLSKLVVYGGLALISCALALITLSVGVRLPASGLILWGPLEMFVTLALTALAGVSTGLLISALNRKVNSVTYLVLAVLFVQILLPGVLFAMEGPLEAPSRLTITRWSLESLGATTDITSRDAEGRFVVRNVILDPDTCKPIRRQPDPSAYAIPSSLSVTYATEAAELSGRWAVLLGFSVVLLVGAGAALSRSETF